MLVPIIDHRHHEIRRYVQYITKIYFSRDFTALRKELEIIYQRSGTAQPGVLAFEDALYATMMQEGLELFCR